MDVSGVLAIVIFALTCELSSQRPQVIQTETTTQVNENNTTVEVEAKNCETARRIPGSCIQRQFCDFGTPAIDRTLFAPRGYIRQCNEEQVCCPFDAQTRQTEASLNQDITDDLDFADDE